MDEAKLTIPTERMIELVKAQPCIWDRLDDLYKDKYRKEQAWTEIYKELYPNFENLKQGQKIRIGQQITKKWCNIRDAYVKSIKSPKRRAYLYAQRLTFMDPIIRERKERGALESLEDTYDHDPEEIPEVSADEEPEIWLDKPFIDVDEGGFAKKPKLEMNAVDDNETVLRLFNRMIQREQDEDRAFFTSITPQVRTLTDNAKLKFRIQVMKLLKKLKNEDNTLVIKSHDSDSE